MDLARSVYSRDLKIVAMRALDAGSTTSEIARKYQLSPKLLERWRGEWRAKGELAFPGTGRRGAGLPALDDAHRVAVHRKRDASARFRTPSWICFQPPVTPFRWSSKISPSAV